MGASTRNSHLPPDRIFVHLPIPGKSNAASARDGEDGASACSSSSTRAAPAYYTRMVEVGRDNLYATTFSQLKRNFLQDVGVVYPEVVRGDTKYQFYTAATDAPVPDVSCLGLYCPLGNCAVPETDYGHHSFVHQDFVLKPVAASGLSKGELSYYYAHSSSNSGSASRAGGASAPARQPMDGGKAAIAHNKRQSPFGTNIELYETITKYLLVLLCVSNKYYLYLSTWSWSSGWGSLVLLLFCGRGRVVFAFEISNFAALEETLTLRSQVFVRGP